jgi:hypothetical protein
MSVPSSLFPYHLPPTGQVTPFSQQPSEADYLPRTLQESIVHYIKTGFLAIEPFCATNTTESLRKRRGVPGFLVRGSPPPAAVTPFSHATSGHPSPVNMRHAWALSPVHQLWRLHRGQGKQDGLFACLSGRPCVYSG